MYFKPYIEIVANLRSMLDFSKSIDLSRVNELEQIVFKDSLEVTPLMWFSYKHLVNWKKKTISPIFPYSLLTHLQIQLASHSLFPSQPLGILHKRETIQQLGQLKLGTWDFETSLRSFKPIENGYEASIVTNLFIDGVLVWQSETIGFIKDEDVEQVKKKTRDKFDSTVYKKVTGIKVNPFKANQYAWISGNIDPIHFSPITAKLMGHPTSIMHGMWSVGRIASALAIDNFEGTTIKVKFISGFYLPGKADILTKKEDGVTKFCLYNDEKDKPYLIGEVDYF